jgi:hypothetical protein
MALQMCVIAMLACLSGSPVAQEASGLAEIQALGLDAALHPGRRIRRGPSRSRMGQHA